MSIGVDRWVSRSGARPGGGREAQLATGQLVAPGRLENNGNRPVGDRKLAMPMCAVQRPVSGKPKAAWMSEPASASGDPVSGLACGELAERHRVMAGYDEDIVGETAGAT